MYCFNHIMELTYACTTCSFRLRGGTTKGGSTAGSSSSQALACVGSGRGGWAREGMRGVDGRGVALPTWTLVLGMWVVWGGGMDDGSRGASIGVGVGVRVVEVRGVGDEVGVGMEEEIWKAELDVGLTALSSPIMLLRDSSNVPFISPTVSSAIEAPVAKCLGSASSFRDSKMTDAKSELASSRISSSTGKSFFNISCNWFDSTKVVSPFGR
mmetsp:Transcript_6847/g.13452  ORF Transcript_6847/g.13452 Transcript_6847/m.13452 type:complete len:212 (-) Transcript_6847:850-1485(-)